MIKFKKLVVENFCSFKHQEIDLTRTGVFLVLGQNKDEPCADSNGSGKSLILEAFCWALWGETIRGISTDEVVNKFVGKNTKVSIEFDLNNTNYIVTRYLKHKTHIKENDLTLYINDIDSTSLSMKATQALINQAVGLDFESFCYLTPGSRTKISALTDKGFKELLESFTKLHLFDRAHEHTKSLIKTKEQVIFNINKDITKSNIQISELEITIEQQVIRSNAFEEQQQLRIIELLNKLDSIPKEDLLAKQVIIEGCSLNKDKVALELQEITNDIHNTQTTYNQRLLVVDKLHQKQLTQKAIHMRDLTKFTTLGDVCTTCSQAVATNYAHTNIQDITTKLNKVNSNIEDINKARVELQLKFDTLLQTKDNQRKELLQAHTDFCLAIDKLSKEVQVIKHNDQVRKMYSDQIIDIQAQSNTYTSIIEEHEVKLTKLKQDLTIVQSELAKETKELEVLQFWLNAFSAKGLRSYILKKVTPFVNKRLMHYCQELTQGSMHVSISTEKTLKNGTVKDDFSITTKLKNGSQSYAGCSEGEKARVDLVLSLAMSDLAASWLGIQVPLRWYDECFESIDATGLSSIVSLLHADTSKYATIFVITHNAALKEYFDNRILVTKHNGESKFHE